MWGTAAVKMGRQDRRESGGRAAQSVPSLHPPCLQGPAPRTVTASPFPERDAPASRRHSGSSAQWVCYGPARGHTAGEWPLTCDAGPSGRPMPRRVTLSRSPPRVEPHLRLRDGAAHSALNTEWGFREKNVSTVEMLFEPFLSFAPRQEPAGPDQGLKEEGVPSCVLRQGPESPLPGSQ